MNMTVLSQLKTVAAELLAQEEQLTAQLATIREKQTGIRAVVQMFSGESDSTADADLEVSAASAVAASTEAVPEKVATKQPSKKATKKKTAAAKTAASKKTATTRKKKDGRSASWQKYVRPGMKNEAMPDAVKLILETQPDKEFKIAEMMDALIKADMPKAQYLKARNRISNVLSGGVRAGDWYRGQQRATYRITDK